MSKENAEKFAVLFDVVRTVTAHARAAYKAPTKAKQSAKAAEVQKIVSSGEFGCNSHAVAKLVTAILGEKITYQEGGGRPKYKIGTALVKEGRTFIVWSYSGQDVIDIDQERDTYTAADHRPATEAEVKALFANEKFIRRANSGSLGDALNNLARV